MAGDPRYSDDDLYLDQMKLQSAWSRFWVLLDSESVRLFVWPFYTALLAWGLYASFFAQPISLIEPTMGHLFYRAWCWVQIPGTLFVMVGLVLRHGGTPVAQMGPVLLFRDYLGLWMQVGGHACMALVLLAFEVAAIKGAYWGQATFSVFAIAPYVLGCVFLTVQTARKLWRGERLHRHRKNGK